MSHTEILANHVAGGRFEDLPSNVIGYAKRCIMDTVSCGLGGRRTPDADVLIATMKEIGGKPEATIFGDKTKLSFMQAAQVNRVLTNMLDYDDAYMKVGHMTVVLVPGCVCPRRTPRLIRPGYNKRNRPWLRGYHTPQRGG